MKCFRWIYAILVSIPLFLGADAVSPLDQIEISNGEIYLVKIESDKSSDELKQFKNQMINDVMYVLDYKEQMGVRLFEVFVTDPPQQKKNGMQKPPPFLVKEFKYKYLKKNTQSKIESLKIDYQPVPEQSQFNSFVVGTILLIVLLIIIAKSRPYIQRKIQLKRIKKQKSKEILQLINTASRREEYESILEQKKYIDDLFVPNEELNLLMDEIERIQYHQTWSDSELGAIESVKSKIGTLRMRNGV